MPATRRLIVLAVLLLVFPFTAVLAQNENETVGFQTNHVFESGQFGENIDILNGGLNLTIPIGPHFMVNSTLGYGLKLSYSSKVWDPSLYQNAQLYATEGVMPYNESSFGFGFNASLGRMFIESKYMPGTNPAKYTRTYKFVAPDGSQHDLYFDDGSINKDLNERDDAISWNTTTWAPDYFIQKATSDNTYYLISGPKNEYCYDPSATPSTTSKCYRVESPDGLVYTMSLTAAALNCADPAPPSGTGAAYSTAHSEQQSYCGWYTTLIEDPSVGSRIAGPVANGPFQSPYPNNVKITYDSDPGFEHVISTITDSAGRTVTFNNCEYDPGNPVPSSCKTSGGTVNRHAVMTTSITVPAIGNSTSLDSTKQAVYGFRYNFARVKRAQPDLESCAWCSPSCPDQCADWNLPVLTLAEVDYPDYQRVSNGVATPYSLYFGYNDYGELTCRTLPTARAGANLCVPPQAATATGFFYVYDYYYYVSQYLSNGKMPNCPDHSKSCSTIPSGQPEAVGVSRQLVRKTLQIQPSGASGDWFYDRGFSSAFTNPKRVRVRDPFGNDTIYYYRGTLPWTDPSSPKNDTDDGYSPDWDDGLNYQIDYYQGLEANGRIVRSETMVPDADTYRDGAGAVHRVKANTRTMHEATQYRDDLSKESIVSRDQWDGFGHWGLETETGFGVTVPRITQVKYQNLAGGVYRTDRLIMKEVSDGVRVLSRTDSKYLDLSSDPARGALSYSIQRVVPPGRIATGVDTTTFHTGDIKTVYTYSPYSGNVIQKQIWDEPSNASYSIKYTYGPEGGGCQNPSVPPGPAYTPGECGGYLATKAFLNNGAISWKAIDRDRDGNTGLIFAARDTAGVATTYVYDSLGRVTKITPADEDETKVDYADLLNTTVTQGSGSDFIFAHYLYDALGRLVATEKRPADPSLGYACQKTQYDLANRITFKTEWKYLTAGTCNGTIDASTPGTQFDFRDPATGQYDAFGRVRREVPADANLNTLEKVTQTDYFGMNSKVTVYGVRAPGGTAFPAVTTYLRDALNRLVTVDAPLGKVCGQTGTICSTNADCPTQGDVCVSTDGGADARYSYDALDRLERVDLTDNFAKDQVRRFAYDGLGRTLWANHPESGTTTYGDYDALGNPLMQQDAKGNVRKFYYDFAGRLTTETVTPAGSTSEVTVTSNVYDEPHGQKYLGKLTTIISNDESANRVVTESRTYSGVGGRLSQITHDFSPTWSSISAVSTNYTYDSRGQLTSIIYPHENPTTRTIMTVNYGYLNGSVVSASESETPAGGQATPVQTLVLLVTYNAAGAVATVPMPGGAQTTITFDQRNRPQTITGGALSGGHRTYESGTYQYDGAGNIYQIGSNTYGYDGANRLTSAHTVYSGNTYDETFAYDIFGNMKQHNTATTTGNTTSNASDAYTFDYATAPWTNRIPTRTTNEGQVNPTGVVFSYDADGNLTQGGKSGLYGDDIKNYLYGALNRLQVVQQVGVWGASEVDRFAYDSRGNRVWRIESGSGTQTYSVRDASGQVLSEFRGRSTIAQDLEWSADYVYLAGRLLALKETQIPRAPVNLRATQVPSGSQWRVNLAWDPNPEADKASYKIYRKQVAGLHPTFNLIATISATSATYLDQSFAANTRLIYYITCVNSAGYESRASAQYGVTVGDQSGPGVPILTAVAGDRRVTLSWTASTDISGVTGYVISRRLSVNDPITPITQTINGLTYVDQDPFLQNGTTYLYLVRATDGLGNWGGWSCQGSPCDTAATPVNHTTPSTPMGVHAAESCGPVGASESIIVSWDQNPATDCGGSTVNYNLYRNTDPKFIDPPSPGQTLVASGLPATTFTDPDSLLDPSFTPIPSTNYYYAVRAVCGSNSSPFSQIVAGNVRDESIVPSFRLWAKAGDGNVSVRWNPSDSALRYFVYRKLNATGNCGSYTYIGTATSANPNLAGAWEWFDGTVANNTAYSYAVTRIVSCNQTDPACSLTNEKESGFSQPILSIPLSRPSNFFQCQHAPLWGTSETGNVPSWSAPSAPFYQPILASTADGTFGFLRGYHLYHYKVCGIPVTTPCFPSTCYNFPDNSPLRQVLVDSTHQDPYLISRTVTSDLRWEDPRYFLSNADTTLSPTWPTDTQNITDNDKLYGNASGCYGTTAWTIDSTPASYHNCIVPKSVYKVYAEGTWLAAESDWPDYFNTKGVDSATRCQMPLYKPGTVDPASLPQCTDAAANPNYVPPPTRVTATSAGPGAMRISWTPPILSPTKPRIAGYYLYSDDEQFGFTFSLKAPLPFAVAGPGDQSITIPRIGGGYFRVATVDELGRVSTGNDLDRVCDQSIDTVCAGGVCPVKHCGTTNAICGSAADCGGPACGVTHEACTIGGTPCGGYCDNSQTPCTIPPLSVHAGVGAGRTGNTSPLPTSFVVSWSTQQIPPFLPPPAGSGLIMVVGSRSSSGSVVSSVSGGGGVWQAATGSLAVNTTAGITTEIWYSLAAPSPSDNFTVNLISPVEAEAAIAGYTNLQPSNALDQVMTSVGAPPDLPNTGTTASTTQASEVWVGAITTAGATLPTTAFAFQNSFNLLASTASSQSPWDLLSYLGGRVVNFRGGAWTGSTFNPPNQSGESWAASIATFRTTQPGCPGNGTCLSQSCAQDSCFPESCKAPDTASASSQPYVSPGTVAPPYYLKTILWTLNDKLMPRARNGIRLQWLKSGGTNTKGFRVYRSASPDGPFCALLHTGTRTLPLPSQVPSLCSSDVPNKFVNDDVAWSAYSYVNASPPDYNYSAGSSDGWDYWDRTVANDTLYYYRVTEVDTVGGVLQESPFTAGETITGRELVYDKTVLPPPQGFKAWAPPLGTAWAPADGTYDMQGVYLKWCAEPAPIAINPDMPAVTEYDVYRAGRGVFQSGGPYMKIARLAPACISPGNRCEITTLKMCSNGIQPQDCQPIQPNPEGCGDSPLKPCAVVDLTFQCWPHTHEGPDFQNHYNYYYVVTAKSSNPDRESMPSFENGAWLNYCGTFTCDGQGQCTANECPANPTCTERRDPDGNGTPLVCGDEDVRLRFNDQPAGTPNAAALDPVEVAAGLGDVAPYRTIGQTVTYNPPAKFVFYHQDHLGSTRVITDIAGAVVSQHHYLPFGEERPVQVEGSLNTRAFTGHERDSESGLDYMLARYYSSSLGRFMAVDPVLKMAAAIGNPQRWNRYAYTLNNPLKFMDPDGRDIAIATGGNSAGVKSMLVNTAMRPTGRADLQRLASDKTTTTTYQDSRINTTAAVKGATPGKTDLTFERVTPVKQADAQGNVVRNAGSTVEIDTYAVSQAHPDRSGVTTTAHGTYHASDIADQKSDAEAAKGDQPTSATGPAEAHGKAVSAEDPDISREDAEKLVNTWTGAKKPEEKKK